MTELWLSLALLLLPLVVVFLWPALRGTGGQRVADKRAALAALYREQLAELKAALDSGAIDGQQYAELEAEAARNLLAAEQADDTGGASASGRGLLVAMALLLPMAAVGFYVWSGHSSELALYHDMLASRQGAPDPGAEARITRQLQERARSHPDDLTSRYVLAQRLQASGDLQSAVESYRYVVEKAPAEANVKAQLAQALFFVNGSKMTNEIRRLVEEVLALQPDNGTALGLAGIAAFDHKDYRAARDYWLRALHQLPGVSAAAQALAAGVKRAEQALADSGEAIPLGEEAAAEGPSIRVRVNLAEGISAEPATPVFIYARGAESPMPLAIVRLTAGNLPAEVVLDKSRAMMPGRSIANVDSVQLVARLAVKGDARPAPGDWQGTVESLPKDKWGELVTIAIDREL